MALSNTLAKAAKPQDKAVMEYESNGEKIKLSPSIIRKYLVSGGGNITDQECMMFLMLCKNQHLNPFLREAYCIKYGDRSPASMVVGKDVFLKRARRQKDFAGYEAGIIVRNTEDFEIEYRPGALFLSGEETIVGGWAKVYVKGYDTPVYASVSFDEYAGRKNDGSLNSQWSKMPGTMIRKVALCQALREAFPEDFGGLYSQEEISDVSGMTLDTNAVELPDKAKPEPEPEIKPEYDLVDDRGTIDEYENQDIAGELFN